MHVEDALRFVDDTLAKQGHRRLNDTQRAVFQGSWQDKDYGEIRRLYGLGCTTAYLMRDVGPELWQLLSEVLGERVSKRALQGPVARAYERHSLDSNSETDLPPPKVVEPTVPLSELKEAAALDGDGISQINDGDRPPWKPFSRQEWGTAPDVSSFRGRERELEELSHWLTVDNCRLLTITGIAGVGKTYLATRLAHKVRAQFEYVVWRSLSHAPPLDDLLTDLIQFLSTREESSSNLTRLMYYLRNHSCLIVLDGFEAIMQSGVYDGSYLPGYEPYREFIRQVGEIPHQGRVVLTSREKPKQIAGMEGSTRAVRSKLLNGMGEQGSWGIFAAKGEGVFTSLEPDWLTLFRRCAKHPLTLNVIATQIWEEFDGRIDNFLSYMEDVSVIPREVHELLQQQFERLSDLEKTIIHCLAQHCDPAEVGDILHQISPPPSQTQLMDGLQSLRRRSLVEVDMARYSLHPLMMEYLSQES